MVWTQKGIDDPEFEGHPECLTNLYSDFKVISLDGKKVTMTSLRDKDGLPIPQWKDIPEGSKFEWKAKTISDGKGESDRINIELVWFDSIYVARVTNEAMDELTEEQVMLAVTDTDAFMDLIMPKIEARLLPELTLKTVYSDTLETGDDGEASGSIELAPQWPTGAYTFMVHYGYSHESERSTTAKRNEIWREEYIPLIVDGVLIALGFLFTGGTASYVLGSIAFANLAYEMSFVAHDYYRTKFGLVSTNRYDCSFPQQGFIHVYSITHQEAGALDDMGNQFSQTNAALTTSIEEMLRARGLVSTVLIGTITVSIILIMLARVKGR